MNIFTCLSSIGHAKRIFSYDRLLLVTQRKYSLTLVFYWFHGENILTRSSSIGRTIGALRRGGGVDGGDCVRLPAAARRELLLAPEDGIPLLPVAHGPGCAAQRHVEGGCRRSASQGLSAMF